MNRICLLNQSTVATDLTADALVKIAAAVQRQLIEHWGPFSQQVGVGVSAISDKALCGDDDVLIVILDDSDQAGDLGYHSTLVDGRPYARVFAGPTLANGGTVMSGADSISCVVSHEALELMADPYATWWADGNDGNEYALEIADPVESSSYDIDGVSVSDFVGSRWFSAGPGPFNWLNTLTSPFQLAPGGYVVRRPPGGSPSAIYGDSYPAWKLATKQHPASRTYQRLHHP